MQINFDNILTEWSYRIPKGFPTIVDGKFTERDEIIILNEILEERGFSALPVPEAVTVTAREISSNDTDTKEALVMVFYDCLRADLSFAQTYANLQKQPTKADLAKLIKTLDASKKFNSDYGTGKHGVNLDNLHELIVQVLSEPKRSKTDKNFKLINNGFSAAHTIATDSKITQYTSGKSFATRGTAFDQIRNTAVKLFQSINVGLNFPDNWCPGDFYLMSDEAPPSADNIVELNSNFAGPSYPKGSIVAISLKMEKAQAGKGTTFVNTVLSVPDVDKSKTKPTNDASKAGTKYLEAKRLIAKYGTGKVGGDVETLRKKLASPFKMIYELTPNKNKIPTIAEFVQFGSSKEERVEQNEYFADNYGTMGQEAVAMIPDIDKKVLSSKNIKAYSDGFEQAYNEFKTYIGSIGIKNIQSAGAKEFVNRIKQGKGTAKEGGPAKILIKKAECYTRAIELIQKWSDKNREIAKPFKKLGTIDNPLLAITMFAIAQHGANPDFFKVHGSDSQLKGTLEIFPTKSKVDQSSIIQSISIDDSENAAGFNVVYNMKLNNVKYSTSLTFRFSQSQFRVEVQELEAEGHA